MFLNNWNEVIAIVKDISAKGNSAEIKIDKNGNIVLYEIKKTKKLG